MMYQRRSTVLVFALAAGTAAGFLPSLAVAHAAARVVQPQTGAALAEEQSIGGSRQGRPLVVHRLAQPGNDAQGRGPDERPALLILAGADARHRVGTTVARELVDLLAARHAELLDTRTVYILPLLNPDNAAWHADRAVPLSDFGRTIAPFDADRDQRVGEDPANDLNGDGLISMMRVERPRPETGLTAEWMIDPDDARLMKKPDAAKGEVATHALLIEGVDDDGDGRFNEDGPGGSGGGGIDLNMNFPAHWPEYADGAGDFALCEPESHALAEWVLARTNIQAVIVFGLHDNLATMPPVGKMDETGRVPLGIEDGDKAYHEAIAKVFKEITGMTGAPAVETAGSPGVWTYAHLGLPTFTTTVWARPDLVKREEKAKEEGERKDSAAPAAPPDVQAQPGAKLADRQALLERGVPDEAVQFLTGDVETRRRMIDEYNQAPAEVRGEIDALIGGLPPDVQARVAALMADPEAPLAEVGAGEVQDRAAARAGAGAPAAGEKRKKGETDDHKWLTYLDEERDGEGFVAWREVEHPQLGTVEVGGFGPHVKLNPPTDEIERLADEQAEFASALLERLPDVVIDARVQREGPGLWRIRLTGRNPGYLPTSLAIAQKSRRLAPVVLTLDAPMESIVSGSRQQRWDSIAGSGGEASANWLVVAPDGGSVDVMVRSPGFGDRTVSVKLEEVRP